MNTRHQILNDSEFWLALEYDMSRILSQHHDKEMRKFWIDGFIPQSVSNTKFGIDVEGEVWIAEGQKNQTKCRFLAKIPQKLLHRKIRDFKYDIVCLEIEKKYLELNIEKLEPNKIAIRSKA